MFYTWANYVLLSDGWSHTSKGVLVNSNQPYGCKFVAIDGFSIPDVPIVKFMIIFFYDPKDHKYAVVSILVFSSSIFSLIASILVILVRR